MINETWLGLSIGSFQCKARKEASSTPKSFLDTINTLADTMESKSLLRVGLCFVASVDHSAIGFAFRNLVSPSSRITNIGWQSRQSRQSAYTACLDRKSWLASDPHAIVDAEESVACSESWSLRSENDVPDSVECFASDVATVLKNLRNQDRDPTLPKLFRDAPAPTFCHTWSLKDWEHHTSRWRYLRVLLSFPRSRLLRRTLPQVSVFAAWSLLVCFLSSRDVAFLKRLSLPLTPLSLISTFVAALLTLRSNQGLERLNSGRLAFGKVVLYTRDIASLIVSHVYPKNHRLGLKLLRHVALYGWLLRGFLRGMDHLDQDLIRTMLEPVDADYVLQQRKAPMAVVMRLRQTFQYMSDRNQLDMAAWIALDHATAELNECLMSTERIRASPIPPLYTSHAGRLLLFYLFFLPLALSGSGMLNGLGTVCTTPAVAYAMLGLDEISFLLEQPFQLMPLFQLCKNAMRDVADTLVIPQPPLMGESNFRGIGSTESAFIPPYW